MTGPGNSFVKRRGVSLFVCVFAIIWCTGILSRETNFCVKCSMTVTLHGELTSQNASLNSGWRLPPGPPACLPTCQPASTSFWYVILISNFARRPDSSVGKTVCCMCERSTLMSERNQEQRNDKQSPGAWNDHLANGYVALQVDTW